MADQLPDILLALGITANYTGYYYLLAAVELATADPSHLTHVTKTLYPAVAKQFSSTGSRVERNLRHVTELAWRSNPQLLQELAGHPMEQRPRVSQLLAILAAPRKQIPGRETFYGQMRLF